MDDEGFDRFMAEERAAGRVVTFVRKGGLVLCACGHARSWHFARPAYYGGPVEDGAPCALCETCREFVLGEFQGLRSAQRER